MGYLGFIVTLDNRKSNNFTLDITKKWQFCFDTPNEWKLPHLCERKDAEHESSIFYGVNYDDGNIKYRVCRMGPFY